MPGRPLGSLARRAAKSHLPIASRLNAAVVEALERRAYLSALFGAAVNYPVGNFPVENVQVADVNGDGKADLITANYNGTVSIFLGNGNGTFQAAQNISDGLGNGSGDIRIAELGNPANNGPGSSNNTPDLLVFNDSNQAAILYGNGDGTFSAPTTMSFAQDISALTIGMFTGDGNPDLAVGYDNGGVRILLSNGDGSFSAGGFYSISTSSVNELEAVAFSSASGNEGLIADDANGQINILQPDGGGTFLAAPRTIVNGNAWGFLIGDVNGDSLPDVLVGYKGGKGQVFLNDGSYTFTMGQTLALGGTVSGGTVADVTGDGKLDLVISNYTAQSVSIFLGNGEGTFNPTPSTYSLANGPVSITAADLNGDGRPDLITANGLSGNISVLLNTTAANNTGLFHAGKSSQVGGKPKDVAVGDLNGDGIPDLVTANSYNNTISVLLGNGDGTFGAPKTYSGFNNPQAILISDLTNNGFADIVVANDNTDTLSILMNNGNGTFQAPQTIFLGSPLGTGVKIALAAAPLDGLGNQLPDIVATDSGINAVHILLNNGDGTFGPPATYSVGTYPIAVAIGDLRGDGLNDIAVANRGSGTVSVLLNNGGGNFSQPVAFAAGTNPNSVAIGDVTGDGVADIVTADSGNYYTPGDTASVDILRGFGDGAFNAPQAIALPGNRAGYASITDVNRDGVPDVVLLSAYQGSYTILADVLLGNADGVLQPAQSYPVAGAGGAALSDLTGNGDLDLVVGNKSGKSAQVLINTTGGAFFGEPKDIALPGNGDQSIATADFNGDGNADLVVATQSLDNLQVFLGNGNGTFSIESVSPDLSFPNFVLAAPVTSNSSEADLIASDDSSDQISVLLNTGHGTFGSPQILNLSAQNLSLSFGPQPIAVGDINGDGIPDLITANGFDGTITVFLGNGNGTFNPNGITEYSSPDSNRSSEITAVAVANLNGHPDIIAANGYSGTVIVLLNNGNGTFQAPLIYPVGNDPFSIAVSDLNGDGHPDIVVADHYGGQVSVLLNNGNNTFKSAQNFSAGQFPDSIAVADMNQDGKPDIVVTNSGNSAFEGDTVGVLVGNGDGTFASPVVTTVGAYPHGLAVADFNGDGLPDAAVVDTDSSELAILTNNGAPKVTMTNGTVTVTGTNTSTTASVSYSNGTISINIGGMMQSFAANSAQQIMINLGSGDDSIMIGAGVPSVVVDGGGGNDTLMGMNSSPDTLMGGSGSDLIMGGVAGSLLMGNGGGDSIMPMSSGETVKGNGGNDTISPMTGSDMLIGGAGDDLFIDFGDSADSIDGGAGLNFAQSNLKDTMANIFQVFDPPPGVSPAIAAAAANAIPSDAAPVTDSVTNGILRIVGTSGADTISLTSDGTNIDIGGTNLPPAALAGLIGVSVKGKGGDDVITIASSITLPATINGNGGNDSLSGGGGDNVMFSGAGNDTLVGGGGMNLLVPGNFETYSAVSPGNDSLVGGNGYSIADFSYRTDGLFLSNDGKPDSGDPLLDETTTIATNISAIWGGTGNDTIVGTHGGEFLSGGHGADSITGGGAGDLLVGGKNKDTVAVAAEPVTLYLRDNKPDDYSGVFDPAEDILSLDAGLDSLIPSS